jgi:hypothetical protein
MFFAMAAVLYPLISVAFMSAAALAGLPSEDGRLFVLSAIVTAWAVIRLEQLNPEYTPLSTEIRAALRRRRERRRELLEQTPGLGKAVRLSAEDRASFQDSIDV